jgi:hypothetical protein
MGCLAPGGRGRTSRSVGSTIGGRTTMMPVPTDHRVDQMLRSPQGQEFIFSLIHSMSDMDLDGLGHPEAKERIRTAVAAQGPLPDGPVDYLAALACATFWFGFSGNDEWLWPLLTAARQELCPVAEAVVTAVARYGWWDPVQRSDQRLLVWDDHDERRGETVEDVVRAGVERACRENDEGLARSRPRLRPGRRRGARWWSAPDFAPLTWTTGAVEPLPTTALLGFVDTHQPFEPTGASVLSVKVEDEARVYEVADPEDWQRLVERFPMDVTGTHDGEWRDWGNVAGPWTLPDWSEVMKDFDGVHMTVGGFVTSCGLALPVGKTFTMLTGWIPDATLWLHDVTVDRQVLGRWYGTPTTDVAEVMAGWTAG